eukprot:CAMPEP_0184643668 /NCGR_PEP_ID=MMETSP0308-20130426/493_1 /TAXON_ID=38269 /ORGANISM="Gloeochaete witrockiana, Strain SAG 46.84" /LENGTH=211 /DNA_ID=CAMNT_0027071737 /DNA_START=111 /DNA_END=746 /DNA_ORIENTATION=+
MAPQQKGAFIVAPAAVPTSSAPLSSSVSTRASGSVVSHSTRKHKKAAPVYSASPSLPQYVGMRRSDSLFGKEDRNAVFRSLVQSCVSGEKEVRYGVSVVSDAETAASSKKGSGSGPDYRDPFYLVRYYQDKLEKAETKEEKEIYANQLRMADYRDPFYLVRYFQDKLEEAETIEQKEIYANELRMAFNDAQQSGIQNGTTWSHPPAHGHGW